MRKPISSSGRAIAIFSLLCLSTFVIGFRLLSAEVRSWTWIVGLGLVNVSSTLLITVILNRYGSIKIRLTPARD